MSSLDVVAEYGDDVDPIARKTFQLCGLAGGAFSSPTSDLLAKKTGFISCTDVQVCVPKVTLPGFRYVEVPARLAHPSGLQRWESVPEASIPRIVSTHRYFRLRITARILIF